jgi:hypothetical protein
VPKEYRKAMERQSDGVAASTGARRGLFLGEARHG